ncbi:MULTISPECIES: iron ABC transporter permease [Paenibacillus]|uniref:Iron chelate uptake ABC transporter family permease subunit n=1 Tax=Paenibacillus campinasensis TaxID=66347 RepID=A0ABW9T447_9BACL|nr:MULTISPECIES: iron ABC transporter permease [Paenibacillus]MUG66919.1 iron chelate uptake ABC transporter family permease subunit [Paenibacillus campinasensis]PAK55931.1 iron ABC transporter permease [Paenibacillus sp. 7541]
MKPTVPFRSRHPFLSALEDRRVLILLVLLLVLMAALVLGACLGSTWESPFQVLLTMAGVQSDSAFVIGTLRLPRLVLALLSGAGLSLAGAVLQGLIRNPLASPDVLGMTGGASAAAVGFIALSGGALSIRWLPVAAMIGALLVSGLIYLLAWKNGVSPVRLVLIGVGISAGTSSVTMLLLAFSSITSAGKAYIWLTGSVYGASWEQVLTLLPWLLLFGTVAWANARKLNVHQLGDEAATGLGAAVQRQRLGLILVAVALAGSSVALVGAVGFIGLIGPHIARRLVGSSYGVLLPASALVGALLLLLADTAGRTLFQPLDIPAGVFTAAIGAPFFIALLVRHRRL